MRAEITLTQRAEGKTATTQAHILQGEGGRYRMEYISPEEARGRVIASDGAAFWQYDPKRNTLAKTLQITGTGQGGRKTDPLIERNYKIALLSDKETLAGRRVYLLELTPAYAGMSLQRRWVDQKTFKTLRIETRYPDGVVSRNIVYTPLALPASVSATDFQPPKTPGVRLIDASAPADAASAQERAKIALSVGLKAESQMGFQLMRVAFSEISGKKNTQCLFSNGVETVSIFVQDGGQTSQTVPANWRKLSLQGDSAFLQRKGHSSVIVWSRNGHRYTAIARMVPETLQAYVCRQIR